MILSLGFCPCNVFRKSFGYQLWLAQPKNSDRMKEQEETILDARSTKTFITRNPVMRTKGKVKQMTKVTIPTTKRGSDTVVPVEPRLYCG